MNSSSSEGPTETKMLGSLSQDARDIKNSVKSEGTKLYNNHNHVNISDEGLRQEQLIGGYFSPGEFIALAGATSGFLAGVVVCPLDVVKTRLQARMKLMDSYRASNHTVFKEFQSIFKEDGIRGFYRGLVPITLGYLPTWMIYFTVYENSKHFYNKILKRYNIDSATLGNFCSALTAGMSSSIAVNPMWVVKTRLMVQVSPSAGSDAHEHSHRTYYKGTIDAFRRMYREEGIKVFYSGLIPSLFGLVHVGIQFPVYEKLKLIFNYGSEEDSPSQEMSKLIVSSCLAKMIASTVTYPHEILRTILQIKTPHPNGNAKMPRSGGVLHSIASVYHRQGLKGFYAGYGINLVRTVPASAVTLVSFEYIKNFLIGHNTKL